MDNIKTELKETFSLEDLNLNENSKIKDILNTYNSREDTTIKEAVKNMVFVNSNELRDIVVSFINNNVMHSSWANYTYAKSMKEATTAQLLNAINQWYNISTDLTKVEAGSIIEELEEIISRDTFNNRYYDNSGLELHRPFHSKNTGNIGTTFRSPKYPRGYQVSKSIYFNNSHHYPTSCTTGSAPIFTAYEETAYGAYPTQLTPKKFKIEFRLRAALELPNDGATYKEGVETVPYMIEYIGDEEQAAVKLSGNYDNFGDGFNVVSPINNLLVYKYARKSAGVFNLDVYLKTNSASDSVSLNAGDVIACVSSDNMRWFQWLPLDFVTPPED